MIVEASPENISRAAALLRDGQCVGMPTETVYGLAGDALNPESLARIFEIKNRPFFVPLIVHVAEGFGLEKIAEKILPAARALMMSFWPGPLTLLLPRRGAVVPDLATAGLPTVAVRCPAHPVAQALLREFGGPLAAPSANKFGRISPTTAGAVADELGGVVPLTLDGGACRVGVESTILDVSGGGIFLLRAGGVALEELEKKVGKIGVSVSGAVTAPGMLKSHYAPRTLLVRLSAAWPEGEELPPDTALLAWRNFSGAERQRARVLAPEGDMSLAAARLFRYLRELDALGVKKILSEPVPMRGLGRAINDRLERAAG
ncbi:MAG: threonylcarbamoyl-AMP synthase [Verrucomicrobiales bacterium]|jgi:L-threonylcarbamoyladenylate synthase|nr:threonylcarbamoyl-AMP synthase [Verrucomicrobiales bacterium]